VLAGVFVFGCLSGGLTGFVGFLEQGGQKL
jgi:hypothetical protein